MPKNRLNEQYWVLTQCDRPGASVASVVLTHGVNANLLHKSARSAFASGRQHHTVAALHFTSDLPIVHLPCYLNLVRLNFHTSLEFGENFG